MISNLFTALRHLRNKMTEQTVWTDAICINQMDLDERAQQVPVIKDIFHDADGVVIWLGPESITTALALK